MAPPATRVLVAADKFKGSLTAAEVGAAVRDGLQRAQPDVEVEVVAVADGGDGTVDAAVAAGYEAVRVMAAGPTGTPHPTSYARFGDSAVVELASSCGLVLLPGGVPTPWTATSRGFGDVVAAALDAGCRRIVLAVGGSASTDGGAGLLLALGARLVAATGAPLDDPGARLDRVAEIDLTGLHPALAETDFVVACDVDNPLTGPHGAAAVYGAQKGFSDSEIDAVDQNLGHWADLVGAAVGRDRRGVLGAGAAGGVGFAALTVLGARVQSGIDTVLNLVGFSDRLDATDFVITGEGALDLQTLAGKAPAGVAAAASAAGIKVIAVCGHRALTPEQLQTIGIRAAFALDEIEPDRARCMRDAAKLLRAVAEHIGRTELEVRDDLGR